ncbi:hypothetical protein GBA52_016332 [Prunus armeniaca]|nr:hypothetical protein GBA52_016332 [Prunus armeniaca]
MLLAIAALLISIGELICRGKRAGVVFIRRRGCWFYHPPPPRYTPFGTLLEIYGLVAGIAQCICSIVQYGYCLRHADSPLKASLLPAIFLICIVGSRLSNMRMNANTTDNMGSWENSSSTEETLLHPIPASANIPLLNNQEVEVEGNIEHQEQEQEQLLLQLRQQQQLQLRQRQRQRRFGEPQEQLQLGLGDQEQLPLEQQRRLEEWLQLQRQHRRRRFGESIN